MDAEKWNQLSLQDKKLYIADLIRKISDHYGGDSKEWLVDYIKDRLTTFKDDLLTLKSIVESMHSDTQPISLIARQNNLDSSK